MPAPFFVTVPDVVITAPDMVPVDPLAPSNVKAYVLPVTFPLQVNVPDVVAVIVAPEAPSVIAPLKLAFPPVFVNAPAGKAVKPVPFNVKGSVALDVSEKPFISKTAPDDTLVKPDIVPNGPLVLEVLETPNFKVPAATVV